MDITTLARSRMRRSIAPFVLVAIAGAATLAIASLAVADGEDGGTEDPHELARLAVDADGTIAEPAIAALRALGPSGHAALTSEHAAAIAALRVGVPGDGTDRLRHAIDVVSGQRDGHASGLYWHTDLDAARAEARRSGRPILSLRLLGRLDEELSCANSRFFRVVLYPDPAIARVLSERYVLHWSSERPAPRITIDMGDGRRIERTITGNSVHYVLDALPGLYAPRQFEVALTRGLALATQCAPTQGDAFASCMRERHEAELALAEQLWGTRRATVGAALPPWAQVTSPIGTLPIGAPGGLAPSAIEAMPLTMGKASIEMPMLRAMARQPADIVPVAPIAWDAIASRDVQTERLSTASVALLALKTGAADPALAARIAEVAAIDGVRNDATMHARVHEWLAREPAMHELGALNARIYDVLFLTPASDPWLGLASSDLWDMVEIER